MVYCIRHTARIHTVGTEGDYTSTSRDHPPVIVKVYPLTCRAEEYRRRIGRGHGIHVCVYTHP